MKAHGGWMRPWLPWPWALGGAREAVVARELTKKFEEFRRGSLSELAEFYADADAPRGEAVVLVGPAVETEPDETDIDAMIRTGAGGGAAYQAAFGRYRDADRRQEERDLQTRPGNQGRQGLNLRVIGGKHGSKARTGSGGPQKAAPD